MNILKYVTVQSIFFFIFLVIVFYIIFFNNDVKVSELEHYFSDKKFRDIKPKPKKKLFKHEEECRRILEEIFGVPFDSVRPDFLKNKLTGRNLELDCFNPDIETPLGVSLACEFDGIGHAEYTPCFHKSEADFHYQVQKDRWKDIQCLKHGILLIRVPHTVPFIYLKPFILSELNKHGVKY